MLIASTPEGVVAYQLCHRENKASYRALLSRIPAPIMVVTDGNSGALAAIKECWTTTRIQRCLVHIQRNIRGVTAANPKTDQHKALRQLGINLTRITTPE
ncbi:transposase [Trueperella pyogenes]|uniref:transposase n=1 Tax=Trueperella pyogenes TaxID=1661 RepID=UPI00131E37C0|nr:transposase [Trueperella pyogenes]